MRSSVEGLTDVPEEVRLVRHRRKKLRPSAENANSRQLADEGCEPVPELFRIGSGGVGG